MELIFTLTPQRARSAGKSPPLARNGQREFGLYWLKSKMQLGPARKDDAPSKERTVNEAPENSSSGAPQAPAFQPVASTYQATGAPPQPAAPPPARSSTLKIVLILLGVFAFLVVLAVGAIGYTAWRVSRAIRIDKNGGMTVNTGNGTISSSPTDRFTADELGTDVYPGAQVDKGGMRVTLPTGPVVAANFLTSDPKDKVVAFYKDRLGSGTTTMDIGTGAILQRTRNNQDAVTVTIVQRDNQDGGKTQIHIMHTTNNKAQTTVTETTAK